MACVAVASLAMSACAGPAAGPGGTASPTASARALTVAERQLSVLRAVGGKLEYCDPDLYPVAHGDPVENAVARLPVIIADHPTYVAILEHLAIPVGTKLDDHQLVSVNDAYKQMRAIQLVPVGGGDAFDVTVPSASGQPERVRGTVSEAGRVRITSRGPGRRPMCPICLARGVEIATPRGPVAVQDVRVGLPVWTVDARGHRVRAVVVRTGHVLAPVGHRMVHLRLADGRSVVASPGHPTIDGQPIGAFTVGDPLDGSVVVATVLAPYTASETYDLLPSGPTGAYLADGILLRSTLGPVTGHGVPVTGPR